MMEHDHAHQGEEVDCYGCLTPACDAHRIVREKGRQAMYHLDARQADDGTGLVGDEAKKGAMTR